MRILTHLLSFILAVSFVVLVVVFFRLFWHAFYDVSFFFLFQLHNYVIFQLAKSSEAVDATGYVFLRRKSFSEALMAYTSTSNSREYYRGRLVHSWPISDFPVIYSSFNLYLYAGVSATAASKTFSQGVVVGKCTVRYCKRNRQKSGCDGRRFHTCLQEHTLRRACTHARTSERAHAYTDTHAHTRMHARFCV